MNKIILKPFAENGFDVHFEKPSSNKMEDHEVRVGCNGHYFRFRLASDGSYMVLHIPPIDGTIYAKDVSDFQNLLTTISNKFDKLSTYHYNKEMEAKTLSEEIIKIKH